MFQTAWSANVPCLPRYTKLDEVSAQDPPSQITDWESSAEFAALCAQQTKALTIAAAKESPSRPFFFSAILPGGQGMLTAQSRDAHPSLCAIAFTSELRAAVYAGLLLGGLKLSPVEFTAAQFAGTLAELEKTGIRHFVLDRCPRCWNFPVTPAPAVPTAASMIAHWSSVKAAEIARANFYLQLARQRASSGDFAGSRDVALHAVAHVAPDDPRFHAHLAEVAESLQDDVLREEAKAAARPVRAASRFAAFWHDVEWRMVDSVLDL